MDSSGTADELRFASTIADDTLAIYADEIGLERIVIGTGNAATAISTATTSLNIDASLAINGLIVIGNSGSNHLIGTVFVDNISGGAGNDILEGGGGVDALIGGAGSDIYIIDNALDQVVEDTDIAINGTDSIQASVSYSMGSNVENLILMGTIAISGTGNNEANSMTGNNAINILIGNGGNDNLWGLTGNDILNGGNNDDLLVGGAGNDELTGGNGIDTFWFNTATNATLNKDVIIDFESGTDKLQFSKSVLTALGTTGQFTSADVRFWASDTGMAHDLDDRLIYNTTTGVLVYDSNGSNAGGAVLLETLGTVTYPALAASDIWII